MPIRPRRPRLPSFLQEKPFANVCNEFARLDKVEITFRHRIQYENTPKLDAYLRQMINNSDLFQPSWRNRNGGAESGQRRERLPYQFRFRDNDMISGSGVWIKSNPTYPRDVRDMEMRFSINFQRFWQNNIDATTYPIHTRNKREEVTTPEHFNLSELFTLQPDNFPLTGDTFDLATNLLDGDCWHNTADVPTLFRKQILFLRNYTEAQFPLLGDLTHAQLQRRMIEGELGNGEIIRLLPDQILDRVGGVAPLFEWDDFYIPHLEIAYDYQCDDAMQTVQSLMMRLLGISFAASAGIYDLSFSRQGNMPCCIVPLTKNVSMAVYAKSLDRLRIEARFKGSIYSILRRKINKESSLSHIIEEATANATRRIIKVLRHLPSGSIEPVNQTRYLADFIGHVYQAFENNHGQIQPFLNSLAIVGSYASPSNGDNAAYEYLVTQGILRPSRPGLRNTHVLYSIMPQYAWIVETLRARHFEDTV